MTICKFAPPNVAPCDKPGKPRSGGFVLCDEHHNLLMRALFDAELYNRILERFGGKQN